MKNYKTNMKTLQLSEEKAQELYKTASPEFRAMLEEAFGKAFFISIETVEDIAEYLGLEENECLYFDKKYTKRVLAFYDLSILCDAWNKQDSFVPDFNNKKQEKWYPVFTYAGCGCSYSYNAATIAVATIGSLFCFKSRERADEFGKKYEHLFKIFLRG